MPYRMIRNVHVGTYDPPDWMLRMPGTSIPPLYVYEGSFLHANEWLFLSFEKRIPLNMIELDGHEKYRHVIFQIDNPTETAAELRSRLRHSR